MDTIRYINNGVYVNMQHVMENLKKDYPNMFRRKEVVVMTRPPNKVIYHDNIPIVTEHATHKEVRKSKDSSPLILSKDYIL